MSPSSGRRGLAHARPAVTAERIEHHRRLGHDLRNAAIRLAFSQGGLWLARCLRKAPKAVRPADTAARVIAPAEAPPAAR
ncbi:hypothetical protein [Phreatobacter sp. AB_2022a]|uniref:hypothetical protein n=1 Tax=Phreatobacter sp. AB_2022a TaxID=3003134 RepID=UPI002286E40C|nr:hypothetical protein [Phreatobacter sp. AB_2022a]MCZ0736458.1 hypothetical protein [Phreatobacter sp. AB_2022a]